MTSNTNLMSTVATTLTVAAILSFGGVTASLAGSNDGGPFKYTSPSNGPDRARAAGYPKARSNV
jgi:hypothetical protein